MKTTNYGTSVMLRDSEALVTPLPGQSYIDELEKACSLGTHSIDIMQYQWNFYEHKVDFRLQAFNRLIVAKARAGIKIRILLNKEGVSNKTAYVNVKTADVYKEAGADVRYARSFPTTHGKLFLVDDDVVILGSHNLSNRSVTVNNETSVLIKGRAVALEYKRYFNSIWALVS